jgi:SAM-dependent methyltransferase
MRASIILTSGVTSPRRDDRRAPVGHEGRREGRAMKCGVCGGTEFERHPVLWKQLVREWELSPTEAEYTDRQQGECCVGCGSNLRSIALAGALRMHLGTSELLIDVPDLPVSASLTVLEINNAGSLTPILSRFAGYVFGAYPDVDMNHLPYADEEFDLVVHSDTLEHVPDPVHALSECRRVLKPAGALCFTVPTIVGRLSRSREGLPSSYHGRPGAPTEDYTVRTEFGCDLWTYVMEAGFEDVSIVSLCFPAATAVMSRRCREPGERSI